MAVSSLPAFPTGRTPLQLSKSTSSLGVQRWPPRDMTCDTAERHQGHLCVIIKHRSQGERNQPVQLITMSLCVRYPARRDFLLREHHGPDGNFVKLLSLHGDAIAKKI
ncbi:hypothetical protein DPMN_144184 [Dreissena polymorpha]|uniref:Uncharacterized protein n=1 Tax=Dreissena polymorpha TaxID=45954 RepID=A0A9D4GHP9_DREPO|nr:hypothetical protein DPMN_144184 [Dreissena polymorpha]